MFKNPLWYTGRIRRLEYNLSTAIFIAFIIAGLFAIINWDLVAPNWAFAGLLPGLWFLYMQRIKRCHDLGKGGWYMFTFFAGFKLMLEVGEIGPNQYGADPKANEVIADNRILDDIK